MIKSILQVLPDTKTSIKYRSEIQSIYFNQYLSLTLEQGLTGKIHDCYFISQRGKDYLETLNQLITLQQK